jgi:tRNA(Ile)-lysidine synthase
VLNNFKSYIVENRLCSADDRILVTVSGGIDSVVLLDLFRKAKFFCGIAHCNFKLRGEESDKDELFVKELAQHYEIPYYSKSFETSEYAEMNNLSIQMAARELRYEWFEELRHEQDYDLVATAHNKNDILETFLLNLARGTGIHGLTGIKNKSGIIIRPLLFASREEIHNYALTYSLEWREDSSNSSLKYSRNKVRNQILPLFDQLNPKFTSTMSENIKRLSETEEIYNQAVQKKKQELLTKETDNFYISIEKIKSLSPLKTWLYELLQDFTFTAHVVSDIIDSLEGNPGRQFYSKTHRLVKDRDKLIIQALKPTSLKKYYIEDPYREVLEPVSLDMDVIPMKKDFRLPKDSLVACLDLDKLDFPLIIRKWEQGDYFRPFGMKNMKKLSDFFIDLKLSIPEKENIWLLTSGPEIIWVIGIRIDDRFRVGPETKKVIRITLKG